MLVVCARLVPIRQERAGVIDAFAVPALRNHVELRADLLLVDLLWLVRVRDVEYACGSVHEGVDEQSRVVGRETDVDRHRQLRGVTNFCYLLSLPDAAFILVDEPDLRRKGGRGECVGVVRSPGPTDLERHTWDVQHGPGLAGMEIPQHHGLSEPFHGLAVLHQVAERAHVVLAPCEGRGQHYIAAWVYAGVVAVAVRPDPDTARRFVGRHPMCRDVVAVIGVLDQGRLPGAVLVR